MAETAFVDILLPRPLRKYLRRNLHPQSRAAHPHSAYLAQVLAQHVGLHMEAADDGPGSGAKLRLRVAPGVYQLNVQQHRRLVDLINTAFNNEFHLTVDHLHLGLSQSMAQSISCFRRLYDLTEDDWPVDTARKAYLRHLHKAYPDLARHRKPGRPRKPPTELSPAYRARLERVSLSHTDAPVV